MSMKLIRSMRNRRRRSGRFWHETLRWTKSAPTISRRPDEIHGHQRQLLIGLFVENAAFGGDLSNIVTNVLVWDAAVCSTP